MRLWCLKYGSLTMVFNNINPLAYAINYGYIVNGTLTMGLCQVQVRAMMMLARRYTKSM